MSAFGGKADITWISGSLWLRPILHYPYSDVGARRAFKGALIVIRLVRLDAGKPHLGFAQLAKWAPDDPLLRKNIIPSHAAPSIGWAAHTNRTTFGTKEKAPRRGQRPFLLATALTRGRMCAPHRTTRGGCCAFPSSNWRLFRQMPYERLFNLLVIALWKNERQRGSLAAL